MEPFDQGMVSQSVSCCLQCRGERPQHLMCRHSTETVPVAPRLRQLFNRQPAWSIGVGHASATNGSAPRTRPNTTNNNHAQNARLPLEVFLSKGRRTPFACRCAALRCPQMLRVIELRVKGGVCAAAVPVFRCVYGKRHDTDFSRGRHPRVGAVATPCCGR